MRSGDGPLELVDLATHADGGRRLPRRGGRLRVRVGGDDGRDDAAAVRARAAGLPPSASRGARPPGGHTDGARRRRILPGVGQRWGGGLSPQRWAHDGGDAVARPEAVDAPGGRRGLAGRGCGSAHGVEDAAARALPDGTALRTGALRDGVERLPGWRALRGALLPVLRGVHVGAAGIRHDGSRRGRRDRRAHHSGACCEKAGSRGASRGHPPRRRCGATDSTSRRASPGRCSARWC